MIFSCELTTTGCLVHWIGNLAPDETVSFSIGRSEDEITERFVSDDSPGDEVVSLSDDPSTLLPNLSGVLDVYRNEVKIRTTGLLPLIPGLKARDLRLLYKLARDHTRSCILRGQTCRLYRKRTDGTPCENCCDPVSGVQLKSNCSVCGGSGKVALWLGPFTVSVLFLQHTQEDTAPAGAGALQETTIEALRLPAFPRPRAGDRLFVPGARQLYILGHPHKTVAGVSGIPAVVDVQARVPDPDTAEAYVPETW